MNVHQTPGGAFPETTEMIASDTRFTPKALAVVALLSVATACTSGGAPADGETQTFTRATRVETIVVTPRSFNENLQVTGAVEALADAMLAAQSSGKVDYIAEVGDQVAEGATVARLDQALAQAALGQAEAQIHTAQAQQALAQDTYDRFQRLQSRAISAQEIEQARLQVATAAASVRQAEAALANAQVQLDNTVVLAPFAGTVEQSLLDKGEHAGTGDPLIRLVSIEKVKVIAGVPERYASDLKVGMSVRLSFPSIDLAARSGEVTFVGSAIEPMSRTFPIEVSVPNPDADLKPMMLAELLVARNRHEGVLTLPRTAIVTDELGPGVYVVRTTSEGAIAQRRAVVLGRNAVGFVIVEEGLDAGDEVIVLGQHSVSDGDPVEVSGRNGATVPDPSTSPAG